MSESAQKRPVVRRRRRRLLFVLLALLIGVAVSAALAEIGFRLFWQMPPQFAMFDQAGLFVETGDGGAGFKPGFRGVLKVGEGLPTDVRINALGMRGDEIPDQQPGDRRLLVLGDSLVFGYGVAPDDTLPAALSRQLAAADRSAVVGNAGIPGFGTRHSAQRMAWLDPQFHADAFVFCGYLGNDATDDLQSDVAVCAGLRFGGYLARLTKESLRFRLAVRSRALLWFETWIFTNKPAWSPLTQIKPNTDEMTAMAGLPGTYPEFGAAFAGLFMDVADPDKTWSAGAPPIIPRIVGNVRSSLLRARELAGDRPLVFALLPTLWQVDEQRRRQELVKLNFDPAQFPRGTAQARWLAVAQELGIPAVDVTAALAAVAEPKTLFVDAGGHLNREGSEIVAREIAAELVPLLK